MLDEVLVALSDFSSVYLYLPFDCTLCTPLFPSLLFYFWPYAVGYLFIEYVCDRQFLRPNAADLSDYGCFVVLALGVASLQMIGLLFSL